MTLFSKIRLSFGYGRAIYIISAILTISMGGLVFFEPVYIPLCVILKLLSIPVIFYLYSNLSRKDQMYFYINLGISRTEYYIIPFAVEFVFFVFLMALAAAVGYAF